MWLFIPSLSARDSRGLSSPSSLRALECSAQSCTLNGKSPSPKSLRLALKKGRFPQLRSGLTRRQRVMQKCALSFARQQRMTESDYSRPGILVSRFPAPVVVAVETIRATFGLGSLTRLSVIARPSASSRMSQATLFSDSPRSAEISKREAMAFRRVYSRRLKLALHTSGSDCSFLPWQTAKAAAGGYENQKDGTVTETLFGEARSWATPNQADPQRTYQRDNHEAGQERPTLSGEAQQWCTPGAMGGGSVSRGGERIGEPLLAGQATEFENWPTPAANDDNKTPKAHLAMKKRMGERDGTGANRTAITSLQVLVQQWPTPRSEDAESCGNHPEATDSLTGATRSWATPTTAIERGTTARDSKGGRDLRNDAANWHTPGATDYKGTTEPGQRLNQLSEDVTMFPTSLPPATTMSDGSERSPIAPGSPPPLGRRKLNPDFVEWLMGLPPLWTLHWPSNGTPVCGPAEMESWWRRRRQRLCSYLRRIIGNDHDRMPPVPHPSENR